MRTWKFVVTLAAATASGGFVACSNATDGDIGEPSGADAASSSDATGGHDATGSSSGGSSGGSSGSGSGGQDSSPGMDGSQPTGDGGVNPNAVVINEISGKSVNWVELYNAGSGSLDLGSYSVAHESKDGGGPSMGSAATLPSGTMLAPGQYALIAEQAADASAGATPVCPDGGQALCFGSTFGISNSDGTIIYVLDPQNNVSSQATYPANVVQSGQTWGRIPNGTGTFQTNLPTPGATNVAN